MTEKAKHLLLTGAALAVVILIAALALISLTQVETGPAPVAWDREACGFCRMHIGDRRFAAQLRRQEGEPVSFDDPGCLFLYLDKHSPKVVELYFRHDTEDRWLDRKQVAFRVGVEQTPMGFGLQATVANVSTGTVGLEQAQAWLRAKQKRSGKQ